MSREKNLRAAAQAQRRVVKGGGEGGQLLAAAVWPCASSSVYDFFFKAVADLHLSIFCLGSYVCVHAPCCVCLPFLSFSAELLAAEARSVDGRVCLFAPRDFPHLATAAGLAFAANLPLVGSARASTEVVVSARGGGFRGFSGGVRESRDVQEGHALLTVLRSSLLFSEIRQFGDG